jgi:hypothetical protein
MERVLSFLEFKRSTGLYREHSVASSFFLSQRGKLTIYLC